MLQLNILNDAASSIFNGPLSTLDGMDTTVGDRIKVILGARQMKATELAKAVGVSRSAVTHWTNGTAIPTADKVFLIADHTGFSPRWIATGKGEERGVGNAVPLRMQLRDDEFNLLLMFQNLPSDLKIRLTDYAKGLIDAARPGAENVSLLQQRSKAG